MAYLIKSTEVYRVESEEAAKDFIEEQKTNPKYEIIKYSSEYKNKKAKGEIVDEWYRVTLVKGFNDEKEPFSEIAISYEEE